MVVLHRISQSMSYLLMKFEFLWSLIILNSFTSHVSSQKSTHTHTLQSNNRTKWTNILERHNKHTNANQGSGSYMTPLISNLSPIQGKRQYLHRDQCIHSLDLNSATSALPFPLGWCSMPAVTEKNMT